MVPDQQIRPEASLFGPGFVSWDGATVYKDDQPQTDYSAGQLVSVFGGETLE